MSSVSREREFELEFRWLASVQAKAREAHLEWLVKLAQDLQSEIPQYVQKLDAEDAAKSADTEE